MWDAVGGCSSWRGQLRGPGAQVAKVGVQGESHCPCLECVGTPKAMGPPGDLFHVICDNRMGGG